MTKVERLLSIIESYEQDSIKDIIKALRAIVTDKQDELSLVLKPYDKASAIEIIMIRSKIKKYDTFYDYKNNKMKIYLKFSTGIKEGSSEAKKIKIDICKNLKKGSMDLTGTIIDDGRKEIYIDLSK